MMLAAPELVIAERIQLFDEVEVPAELQHRMLADRMMRGEEGSEFEARHGFLSGLYFAWCLAPNYGLGRIKAIAESGYECMVVVQTRGTWRRSGMGGCGDRAIAPAIVSFQRLSLIHISEPTRRTPISYAV